MKGRKYVLSLSLLLLLLIPNTCEIFLCSVSLLFLVSLTICGLYKFFFLALSGGKSIVFLNQFTFIWTTLFSLLFFSRTFSLKKSCQKLFIFTWQIKDPIIFFPQTHPRVKQMSVLDWPKQHRREYGRGNRKEEVLAQADFA